MTLPPMPILLSSYCREAGVRVLGKSLTVPLLKNELLPLVKILLGTAASKAILLWLNVSPLSWTDPFAPTPTSNPDTWQLSMMNRPPA